MSEPTPFITPTPIYNYPKYEIHMYIAANRDDPAWMERYTEKIVQHNTKVLMALQGKSVKRSHDDISEADKRSDNDKPSHDNDISIPVYADSGFDLFMPVDGASYGYGTTMSDIPEAARALPLGVKCTAVEIQHGHVLDTATSTDYALKYVEKLWVRPSGFYLYPRSSISKTSLRLANSVGIIDSGYRGELIAAVDTILRCEDPWTMWKRALGDIKKYDRLFQICAPDLSPFFIRLVNEESELGGSSRGSGGFGSTGR